MAYRITGLSPAEFRPLFQLDDAALAQRGARRVVASSDRGFPCRISLQDAKAGEELILLHHVSHDVATPYRSAYAIYVRTMAQGAACYVDALPPVFAGRPIAFRAFDAAGNLVDAALAPGGDGTDDERGNGDAVIRALFANPVIAYIHAHNAAHGCFSARIERQEDGRF